MKKILFPAFIITGLISASAQNCVHTLPSTVLMKKTDGQQIQFGDAIWVCEGLTFEIVGENTTAYIEKNCDITVTGDNQSAVYMKAPGSLTIDGDNCFFTVDSAVVVVDNGSGNTIDICLISDEPLEFLYDNAPTDTGCIDTSTVGLRAIQPLEALTLYPNPVTDYLNYSLPMNSVTVLARISTVSGQLLNEVVLTKSTGNIDMSSYVSGLYNIEFVSNGQRKSRLVSVK